MKILAKIGGAQLEQDAARQTLASAVARAVAAGHAVVLVHGGGNQIRTATERLGLPQRYEDGLRVTDAATADVVTAVLAGLVNKQLVLALQSAGLTAVGVSGIDGGTLQATPHHPGGLDLGFVGRVCKIDTRLLHAVLAQGMVPVVATVAGLAERSEGDRTKPYNINADMAAAPLAQAISADALLFLSDVPGVLDDDHRRIATLAPTHQRALEQQGVLRGGMVPKVQAARSALVQGGPTLVKIAPADGPDALLDALLDEVGTRFIGEDQETREQQHG